MDYKKKYKLLTILFFAGFISIIITGCSDKEKGNTDNTFYIELVNFTHDSLKKNISKDIFGKVAFYKNNKLEVLSVNYLTEDYPDMHFFKNAEALEKKIQPDTKKIKIEFGGEYTVDSIRYSLQKFVYRNKQWVKTSDMGFIKGIPTFTRPEYIMKEFTDQIIKNTVEYSYN